MTVAPPPGWEWIAPLRERHLAPPLPGGYEVELVEPDVYWELFEREMRPHYPAEVFLDPDALLGEQDRQALERLRASQPPRLSDPIVVRRAGELAATTFGHAGLRAEYGMLASVVHPAHRRAGLYSALVQRICDYARDAGFLSVVSDHAPNNVAVMAAKLKAGFVVDGFELDARLGPSVRLRRFLHPAHERAFAFRCSLATLDESLILTGSGAMPLLRAQFAAAERASPPPGSPDGGEGG